MITTLLLALGASGFAQPEIWGGEISVEQAGDCATSLALRANVSLFYRGLEPTAIPDSVELCWGDGSCQNIPLVSAILLEWNVVMGQYLAEHTYPSRGAYVLNIEECCYSDDILSFQSEPDIPVRISNTYTFLSPMFQGCNSQAAPLQPPVCLALPGSAFTYNPNIYDPDGDSISYSLTEPAAPAAYLYPQEFDGCTNSLEIDPITGDLTWDSPCLPGHYLFGIEIKEWRGQVVIAERQILLHVLIDEATGLSSITDPGLFQPAPNPTLGMLQLKGAAETPLGLTLYNVDGQPVREWQALQLPRDVSLEGLGTGIYFLHGTTGKRTFVYKIIKQ